MFNTKVQDESAQVHIISVSMGAEDSLYLAGQSVGLYDRRMVGESPSMGDPNKAGIHYERFKGDALHEGLSDKIGKAICDEKLVVTVSAEGTATIPAIEQASVGRTLDVLHFSAHAACDEAGVVRRIRDDLSNVKEILSVGVQNYSEAEYMYQTMNNIKPMFIDIWNAMHKGTIIKDSINRFMPSDNLYVTIDASVLNDFHARPYVPGGLSWEDMILWLSQVSQFKKIVGMDLVNVRPEDSDVAARLLFNMISYMIRSQSNGT